MGKTALAREVVDRAQGDFEHIVWTSAQVERFVGDQAVAVDTHLSRLDDVLAAVGRQVGGRAVSLLPPAQQVEAAKGFLRATRILVVLDNLETVTDSVGLVDQAISVIGQGRLLITSRHEVAHNRVRNLRLPGLPEPDGILFLRTEGQQRGIASVAQADPKDLKEIHAATGGAPLAMKLVVGQLDRQPFASVLECLQKASVAGQDYAFYRFVYQRSWDMLEEPAQMALVDMSVFPPGSGGAVADVQAISQLPTEVFFPAMDQLIRYSLVDKFGALKQERYALHALTHYFILSDITQEWAPEP
jgi:hypothetical protein